MPDQTEYPTLAECIKEERIRLGLSQADLATRAIINQGNLSRIESGRNPTPGDETLQRIAGVLKEAGADADILEVMVRLRDQPQTTAGFPEQGGPALFRKRTALRIGFAHCIWSAPAILQEDKSAILGVEMYSRARRDNETLQPYKNGVGSQNDGATAQELVELMETGQLDAVLVAQEVVDDMPNLLAPCAQILHSIGGSQILIAYNERELTIKKEESGLCAVWRELITKFKREPLQVLFPPGTNAEHHYSWMESLRPAPGMKAVEIDLGNWARNDDEQRNQDLARGLPHDADSAAAVNPDKEFPVVERVQALVNERGACAFIVWEPYISWLRGFGETAGFKTVSGYMHELGEAEKPLPYISFTLAVRQERFSHFLTDPGFNAYLADLRARCSILSDPRGLRATSSMRVARFLGIPEDHCRAQLSRLPFRLNFAPEWVDGLRDMVGRGTGSAARR